MKAGLRKRFFAWLLKKGDGFNHQIYGSYKRNLLKDISGTIVEIGPGTGVNFKYLPPEINWIGIEPNEAFHRTLHIQAKEKGIRARVLKGDALKIPLPDNSADVLLSTLVLCSVANPAGVLAEIKRILRPGGTLIFIEHVAAPGGTHLRRLQNIFNPLNRIVADGCNCNRETWNDLEHAGFAALQLSRIHMTGTNGLHSPHIVGYAIK